MANLEDPTVNVQPLLLRRFQDLSSWSLAASDNKSLCKSFLLSAISIRDFSARHSVPHSSMKRYMQKYKKWRETGLDTFHNSSGGRPFLLDDTGIINVRKKLRRNISTQSCLDSMVAPFQIFLEPQVIESKKRRGLAGVDCRISKKTVKRIKANNKFVEVTCQFKTHARRFEESDPRNLYSFAIMNAAFLSELSAGMVFNWDATKYCINAEGHATIVKCQGDNSAPATSLRNNEQRRLHRSVSDSTCPSCR